MRGRALYEEIRIEKVEQIPELVTHLLKNPTVSILVKSLEFEFDLRYEASASDNLIDFAYGLGSLVHLLCLLPHLQELLHPPLVKKAHSELVQCIRALPNLRTLGFRPTPNTLLDRLCDSWNNADFISVLAEPMPMQTLCLVLYLIDELSRWCVNLHCLRALQNTCARRTEMPVSLQELQLYSCFLDGEDLDCLLSCCQSIRTLCINNCSNLNMHGFVDSITDYAPQIKNLSVVKCFKREPRPARYDYLADLPSLLRVHFCENMLAADLLAFISPSIQHIGFEGPVLSPTELASMLPFFEQHGAVRIDLKQSEYDQRARHVLEVGDSSMFRRLTDLLSAESCGSAQSHSRLHRIGSIDVSRLRHAHVPGGDQESLRKRTTNFL